MRRLMLIVFILLGMAIVSPLEAQEQTFLSLDIPDTNLKTGQEYEVSILLEGAPEVWVLNAEVEYDPSLLYIIGTRSGSPVRQGDFFSPPTSTVIVRNAVQGNRLVYTISMLAPADPASGTGIVGTFRIHPLKAGAARLSFSRAEVTGIKVSGEGDQRTASPLPIDFTPVLIDLTITGDPVEPPSEATATPMPTETPVPLTQAPGFTAEPTLVNVTRDPNATRALEAAEAPVSDTGPSLPLILALTVMVIGGVGLVFVLVFWRRSSRKR
jgi:hypothetical protein